MRQVSKKIAFDDILPDDQAKRVGESATALTSLKESIRSLGLLDALIVEEIGNGKVRLRAGRSRYKAITSLRAENEQNLDMIPCTVLEWDDHELKDEKWKDYKVSQVIFDSNDKRSALAQIEQARHYQAQMQQFPNLFPDYIALAKGNNKDVSQVKEVMDLLSIDPEVMERIEQIRLQDPGRLPGMCVQEIASAAAESRRPLPPAGQMELVDLLTGSDLPDRRALVLRDKMQTLVREIRRKYVPDNRGRKKAEQVPEVVDAGTSLFEPAETVASVDGTVSTGENETLSDVFPNETGVENAFHLDTVSDTNPGITSYHETSIPRNQNAQNGTSSRDATLEDPEVQTRSQNWESENVSETGTAAASKAANPASAAPQDANVGIVEINLTNVIRTLETTSLSLDNRQYERLMERLAKIRVLLDKATHALV